MTESVEDRILEDLVGEVVYLQGAVAWLEAELEKWKSMECDRVNDLLDADAKIAMLKYRLGERDPSLDWLLRPQFKDGEVPFE